MMILEKDRLPSSSHGTSRSFGYSQTLRSGTKNEDVPDVSEHKLLAPGLEVCLTVIIHNMKTRCQWANQLGGPQEVLLND